MFVFLLFGMNLETFGWLSLSDIENQFSCFESFCFPTLELKDAAQQNSHGFRTTFESMPTERLFLEGRMVRVPTVADWNAELRSNHSNIKVTLSPTVVFHEEYTRYIFL